MTPICGEVLEMCQSHWFSQFAKIAAKFCGHPGVFLSAVSVVILWAITGPIFGFSDTWQLVINTATTIVTFLMVFLIQNTQNRDTAAIHLKLDELIRATKGAGNAMMDLENAEDDQLDQQQRKYHDLACTARNGAQADAECEAPAPGD